MPDINPTELVSGRLLLAISDPTTGFNARWAEIIATRPELPAITIDWTPASTNYIRHALDPSEWNLSVFPREPMGLCQYTTDCVTKPLGERSLFSSFHGDVRAHLDFYLTLRGGVRDFENDTEIYKQAVENAVLQTIHDKTLTWWTQSDPVSYSGQYSSAPELTIQVDDGYAQYVPFQFVFEVHIQ